MGKSHRKFLNLHVAHRVLLPGLVSTQLLNCGAARVTAEVVAARSRVFRSAVQLVTPPVAIVPLTVR